MSAPENARNGLFDAAEARRALSILVGPKSVFEVRALDAQLVSNHRRATVSGYFDDIETCVSELLRLTSAKGVYVTLNPVNPALLARCANRLDYADRNASTSDQHIVRRRWVLIDIDTERPSGIGTTDGQKDAARNKARDIYRWLKDRGWPEPVVGDSGNGFHLLYRIDLPADDDGLVEKLLAALAARFNADGVKIDASVHNPARIARLYGTLAAKGDNTQDRPHRLSRIRKAPAALDAVTAGQLRALLSELEPENPESVQTPQRRDGSFDVEDFFRRHGIEIAETIAQPSGAIKYRLSRCAFNPDHETPGAAVFLQPDGKLGHRCLHNSCTGKGWREFREHFEPGYRDKSGSKSSESPSDDDDQKSPRKSAATELVEIGRKFSLFHDPQDRPFARLEIRGHTEIWPVESAKCRKLLARTYYEKAKKAINRNALADAITTLAGKACHDGHEEPVFLRVAAHGENILIDLCDERWRVIEVSASGWRILDKSPVAFVRTGSMQSLPEPTRGGSIAPLWELLNVTEEQRPLVAGALLNAFHPDGPYFVLNFVGEQGSAKSCAARIMRQLVDPNANPLRSPPGSERDLMAQGAGNRVVALDNLSRLPPWLSDAICRFSTGGGHSARQLYRDLEEISLAVKRPVILNGIEDVAMRPDLAERTLQIELEPIKGKRIPEKKLWPKFEKHCPAIFGVILDALVCALRELPNVELDCLPRMADAALWATAGETAFGFKRGTFMAAYRQNLDESAIASVEAHPVGVAIRQLLEALDGIVTNETRQAKVWPKNVRSLGHCLRRLAPALRRAGIAVERSKGKRREIRLCKRREKTSATSQTPPEPAESRDDGDVFDDLSGDLHGVGYEAAEDMVI